MSLAPPKFTLAALWLVGLASVAPAQAHSDLTFTSWSGPYMRSQMLAFVRPFEQETGKQVNVEFYNGGLTDVRMQVRSANVKWDVVDFLEEDLIRACEAGLLEEIDPGQLTPGTDGAAPAQDFIDNALRPCGVGTMAWATAIGYNEAAFPDAQPTVLADFFDVERFPGQRGLQRDPRIITEWALLADGVPADQVYATLATTEGLERALAVMEPIRPHLVWWQEANEPIDMLNDGQVTITSIWGGEMTDAILRRGQAITPIWDGLVLKLDHLAVVKGSPNRDLALEFIRFATAPEQLANQVKHIYHSPARESSLTLVSDDIKPFLPTTPEHRQSAIENDARFWADNYQRIHARFEQWLESPLRKGVSGAPR